MTRYLSLFLLAFWVIPSTAKAARQDRLVIPMVIKARGDVDLAYVDVDYARIAKSAFSDEFIQDLPPPGRFYQNPLHLGQVHQGMSSPAGQVLAPLGSRYEIPGEVEGEVSSGHFELHFDLSREERAYYLAAENDYRLQISLSYQRAGADSEQDPWSRAGWFGQFPAESIPAVAREGVVTSLYGVELGEPDVSSVSGRDLELWFDLIQVEMQYCTTINSPPRNQEYHPYCLDPASLMNSSPRTLILWTQGDTGRNPRIRLEQSMGTLHGNDPDFLPLVKAAAQNMRLFELADSVLTFQIDDIRYSRPYRSLVGEWNAVLTTDGENLGPSKEVPLGQANLASNVAHTELHGTIHVSHGQQLVSGWMAYDPLYQEHYPFLIFHQLPLHLADGWPSDITLVVVPKAKTWAHFEGSAYAVSESVSHVQLRSFLNEVIEDKDFGASHQTLRAFTLDRPAGTMIHLPGSLDVLHYVGTLSMALR